jgi:adenylate kinase
VGKTLYAELRNDHAIKDPIERHMFTGTKTDSDSGAVPEGVDKVIDNELTRAFRRDILDSDIVIYDMMNTKYEEVDHVIKTFKTSEYEEDKVLILLSSVMSWANTPPKVKKVNEDGEEEEGEEDQEEPEEDEPEEEAEGEEEEQKEEAEGEDAPPKPVVLNFKEKDFHLRVPSRRFQYLKTLETLALSSVKAQPRLRVYVMCAGLLYGEGERTLADHFKQAWLQSPRKLPYVGKGDNLVPTIHVRDLSRLVRKVVQRRPDSYYIFAVDKTKNPTQKRIVEAISKGMGTGEAESVKFDDVKHHEWAEFLTLNLKIRSSDVLKDEEPPEDAEDPEEAAKALKFPWHCKKGIIKNMLLLNNEFNADRGLRPVKILITGPPAVGKTHYAKLLSEYYNIPHITIKDALDLIPKFKGEIGEEMRTFIEEKKDAAMEAFEEREDKKKGETLRREDIFVKLPEKYLYRLMKKKLSENACRNRGYILDGYPRNFRDAQYVFLKRVFKETVNEDGEVEREEPEENDEIEEDEVDEDGNLKQKIFDKYAPDEHLIPDSIILLDGDENYIKRRVKELPEERVTNTHWNNADLNRRNKVYRLMNNSPIGDPALVDFFKKWSIGVISERCDEEESKLVEGFKIFIERNGKPINYMTFDQDAEKVRISQAEEQVKARKTKEADAAEREEYIERQWRKQKEDYTKSRFEQIKEQERDLLDSKSQPIRAYLVDNVVPILTEGLVAVCKNQPEDPVDFLAEFLFREARNIQANNINFY